MADFFVSICIPAYKNAAFLDRLLNSIIGQTFRNFEVVIADDSPNDEVFAVVKKYEGILSIQYQKNSLPLGSPENWNEAMRLAKGEWIKIMHHDDWFENDASLDEFAKAAKDNAGAKFIFSGFVNVDTNTDSRMPFVISDFYLRMLKKTPLILFKQNFIGHPSTTLIKNDKIFFYDKNIKWVVDFEFYIRFLSCNNFFAVRKPLVAIGIHEEQITKQAFRNPEVEIPEVLYLYYKLPAGSLKNIFVYDYYWRFVRNLSIRSDQHIKKYVPQTVIPEVIRRMIRVQSRWNLKLLRIGFISKALMLISYLSNYQKI